MYNRIASLRFEDDKVMAIEDALRYNRLTSYELYDLLGLIKFENNRLHLAKRGFRLVVDAHNYDIMYEILDIVS